MLLKSASTTLPLLRIRNTHPNFFWLLSILTLATLLIGLSMVFAESSYNQAGWDVLRSILPIKAVGIYALIASAFKMYGLVFTRPFVLRFGSALCASFYLSVGLNLAIAFFFKNTTAPTGMILWTAIGLIHILAILEPYTNPANRKD